MLGTVETIHFFTHRYYYSHRLCKSAAIICLHAWSALSKQNFCDIQGLCCNIIIGDHPGGHWKTENNRIQLRIPVTGTLEGNEKQFVLAGNLSYRGKFP